MLFRSEYVGHLSQEALPVSAQARRMPGRDADDKRDRDDKRGDHAAEHEHEKHRHQQDQGAGLLTREYDAGSGMLLWKGRAFPCGRAGSEGIQEEETGRENPHPGTARKI